jgi:hypothetical protein
VPRKGGEAMKTIKKMHNSKQRLHNKQLTKLAP